MSEEDHDPFDVNAPRPWPGKKDAVPVAKRHVQTGFDAMLRSPKPDQIGWLIKHLIFCVYPRTKVEGDFYRREHNGYTLTIQAMKDEHGHQYGVPYGALPRHVMIYIISEVVRTGSPVVSLGQDFSAFLRAIGYRAEQGGKKSGRRAARAQLLAVLNQKMRLTKSHGDSENGGMQVRAIDVTDDYDLWWTEADARTLFDSWVRVSPQFFQMLRESRIPLDLRIIRALHKDTLALDLYAWATLSAHIAHDRKQDVKVPWRALYKQFRDGAVTEGGLRSFTARAKTALKKIASLYPNLKLDFTHGGVVIAAASLPSVGAPPALTGPSAGTPINPFSLIAPPKK